IRAVAAKRHVTNGARAAKTSVPTFGICFKLTVITLAFVGIRVAIKATKVTRLATLKTMSLILLLSFSGKQFRQLLVPAGHLQYYRAEHKIEQNEKENFILGQTRTKTQFQSMSSINDGWH